MIKKLVQFNESNNISIHNGYHILDIFDPEGDGYVEYVAYKNNEFYFLDPDFEVIVGPYKYLDQMMTAVGIPDIKYDDYLDKIKKIII